MSEFHRQGAYLSPIDHRDWLFKSVSRTSVEEIPQQGGIAEVPLIIHDQEDMPTCTGEAGAYAQMINQYFETQQMVDFSSLFVYKMNKEIDGLPPDVEGSTVKATVKILKMKGVCREILYPSSKENYNNPLPSSRYMGKILRNAYRNRIVAYTKCEGLNDILVALSEKKQVVFSMYLLSDFYKARNGRVPQRVGGKNIGGHAMVALNYNKEERWIKVAQSWGKSNITDRGYMYIPFTWFEYQIKKDFPMLMEAYAVLDYIPEHLQLPEKLTVANKFINIEVNGETVKDKALPPLLINEIGNPLVNLSMMEKIIEQITGKDASVVWDKEINTIKINI